MTNATLTIKLDAEKYPFMAKYSHPVKKPSRQIVGRENQMRQILAAFARPELSNVLLLAGGGGGKTALVQGLMMQDENRIYREVQLSKMIADAKDHPDSIAEWLRNLFNESSKYGKTNGHEIVLFIDEFHQIVQLSAAAVEVLKPILADSGTRGIRFVAATTNEEFRKYVSKNQPLTERLQIIRLPQPEEKVVIDILRNMAIRYNVIDQFPNNSVFKLIYDYTNRYVPSEIQPRKSILVLDDMIGYHRQEHVPIDKNLLARVLYDQRGININFTANANKIEQILNKHVISQTLATSAIAHRLQICIADLNDKTRPMASMLFTGSTGVGKTEMVKQMAKLLFNDSQQLIRFDMTEYANSSSLDRFKNELTAQVWSHPYSVLLFDEIEKSNPAITRILLQVLDDGRLSDQNDRTVSFINCYIVMTTNAASEIYKTINNYNKDTTNPRKFLTKYGDQIRESIQKTTGENRFPPELLGRIDTIVPFLPLSEATQKQIAKMHLISLAHEVYDKHGVICQMQMPLINYLVDNILNLNDSNSGGARALMHKMESEITTNIAEFINTYPQIKKINVTVEGSMASEHKDQLINQAEVVVKAIK